jgi:hypothetical protein
LYSNEAAQRAQAVFAENWVVYHYWNVHAHRNEVSVLEVFDDDAARRTPPLLRAVALTALGLNRKPPLSSLAPPAVRVMGQSYFFSMGVKTMAVTSTQRGITSKQVLLGTSTDQVRGDGGGCSRHRDVASAMARWRVSWTRETRVGCAWERVAGDTQRSIQSTPVA